MRRAPTELGVLTMRSLQITSGVQDIQHLVSLFTSETPSNLLLLITIGYHKLEVGMEQLFFSSLCPKLHKLARSTWKTRLCKFLHLYRLELYFPTLNLPEYSCGNDATIINALLRLGQKDEKLRLLNQERLYSNTHFVSCLLLPDTNKIKIWFRPGLIDDTTCSKYLWPIIQLHEIFFLFEIKSQQT